jgi:hypothetical protein
MSVLQFKTLSTLLIFYKSFRADLVFTFAFAVNDHCNIIYSPGKSGNVNCFSPGHKRQYLFCRPDNILKYHFYPKEQVRVLVYKLPFHSLKFKLLYLILDESVVDI